MNLLNNVRQEKKAYFTTAYHCFEGHIPAAGGDPFEPVAGVELEDQYLSLYYETAHATNRGADPDTEITKV